MRTLRGEAPAFVITVQDADGQRREMVLVNDNEVEPLRPVKVESLVFARRPGTGEHPAEVLQ